MDLVEDHELDALERVRDLQDRVAQDLGRHHEHLRLGTDRHIPGHEADVDVRVALEVVKFLVGESLDGGGVDASLPTLHSVQDRELRYEGLSGPSRR